MKKEVLTSKNIEQNVIAFKKKQLKVRYSALQMLIAALFVSVLLIIFAFKFIHWIVGLVSLLLPVVAVAVFLPRIRAEKLYKTTVTCGEYTVIKDTLVNVDKETVVEPNPHRGINIYIGRRRRNHLYINEVAFLYFSSRKWRIPYRCYEWSSLYNMSRDGISNTSIIGDEFYLVILNDTQEICVAYNAKFFEYK